MTHSGSDFRLLGDVPFRNENEKDPLNFDQLAGELAQLLIGARNQTPLTLGIQAPWGMGKSTLMWQLHERLAKEGAKTVWFNAWTFEGQDVLEGLLKTVLQQLDPKVLRRVLLDKRIRTTIQVAAGIVSHLLGVGRIVDRIWDAVRMDPAARNQIRDLLDDAIKQSLESSRGSKHGPNSRETNGDSNSDARELLVVFIDDLDRCSPQHVFRVFEAIKLYLDVRGLVFVIGIDTHIVSDAILAEKKFSDKISGAQYVEKIIQIPYNIPPAKPEQMGNLFSHYASSSRISDLIDDHGTKLVIERSESNPRRIKRFMNSFVLERQLVPESRQIQPHILIKVIILGMYYPAFCRLFTAGLSDPIENFLSYHAVRSCLDGRNIEELRTDEKITGVFSELGLAALDKYPDGAAARHAIDGRVPEEFVKLVDNSSFVSLLEKVGDAESRQTVAAHIRRVSESVTSRAGIDAAAERKRSWLEALDSLRILWVDDHPEHERNLEVGKKLRQAGATLEQVRDTEQCIAFLKRKPEWTSVLLSDVERGINRSAGLEDLDRIRGDGNYAGPVLFFPRVVRPEDRTKAENLGARITNDPDELSKWLGDMGVRLRGAMAS